AADRRGGVVGGIGGEGGDDRVAVQVGRTQRAQPSLELVLVGRYLQSQLAGDDLPESGQVGPAGLERGRGRRGGVLPGQPLLGEGRKRNGHELESRSGVGKRVGSRVG